MWFAISVACFTLLGRHAHDLSGNGRFQYAGGAGGSAGRSLVHDVVGRSGPGGPILVLASEANPFSRYYSEILLTEGLNEFAVKNIAEVTADSLRGYDVAILGEIPVNAGQREMLHAWVNGGGELIAMRPEEPFARAFGFKRDKGTLADAYLAIDGSAAAGKGLVKETIQFHGTADIYVPGEGETVATLYRDAVSRAGAPAVMTRRVGQGQVTVFAYDLARSVVYTRQGDPAWSGMERDGMPPIRSDDLFFGGASNDPRPDWVDLNKVAIPQADEQQRLLANLILEMSKGRRALPRFWYLPDGVRAVVVMTGDDHGHGGTVGRFHRFEEESPKNCSLEEWKCVRATSNVFPGTISNEEGLSLVSRGFEIGLHEYTRCEDWPQQTVHDAQGGSASEISAAGVDRLYTTQLADFARRYPDLPAPTTSRTDCVTWGDYDTQPTVELRHGIRLDTNYYYWPAKWVQNRPGMFTGSGMPMRFAKRDGSLVDVYQAATQMTDESGQRYPMTVDALLGNALGPNEYVGVFTANMHTDAVISPGADAIVASARARGVPVVAAVQMLRWLDGRDGSSFQEIRWDGEDLRFRIAGEDGCRGLEAMLPASWSSRGLTEVRRNGAPVSFGARAFAGQEYAAFPALRGQYDVRYGGQ